MYSRDIVELEGKIRAQEKNLGQDHPEIAESLGQLAHIYFIFGRYADAERLYWRAITICSQWFGSEHLSVATLMLDLGYLLESQDRWAEAEHVYRLAYAIRSTNMGANHHDSLQVARSIVKVVRAQGKIPPERELERLGKVAV